MLLLKCAVCDSKKSRFRKEQESSGILSSSGIRAPLSQSPLVGSLFFKRKYKNECKSKQIFISGGQIHA